MKYIILLIITICLSSCDAFVSLIYSVENKTAKPVKVFVPNYRINGTFGRGVDTVLEIGPHGSRFVGATLPRVTGPLGARKRIYKSQPALCGLKLIKPDTTVMLGCTHKEWKFRGGVSVLKIRHKH